MRNWLNFFRRALTLGVASDLLLIALTASGARGGILQIQISEGETSYVILDEGPLDTLVAPSNVNRIQAFAAALVFPDYQIVGLNASTNNPGAADPIGSNLIIGGEVQRTTSGAAPSLVITATDTDYTQPVNASVLLSSMSTTLTGAPSGDTRTFTSWFNSSNTPYATNVVQGAPVPLSYSSTGLAPNSNGVSAAPASVTSAALYGLTNTTVISLSAGADVVFGGSTVVAAPEPGSFALVALTGMLFVARRRCPKVV